MLTAEKSLRQCFSSRGEKGAGTAYPCIPPVSPRKKHCSQDTKMLQQLSKVWLKFRGIQLLCSISARISTCVAGLSALSLPLDLGVRRGSIVQAEIPALMEHSLNTMLNSTLSIHV
ncbi:Hypothetical predicted protein [Podarcis lilfordi]|uniref:Uncharacterized protein n=1 Tax=Podarcis lilfordi TaxID=74358 RepID=A0AA35P6C2_9SAUR|nr:Hypothetical predicted protein [Podarcis lilfordi]